ncbi:HGGxSTG domain-containing protein [uncultured Ruegeria sp.]|uniref:HGGxSTG domain-containing protein n=1 Tax=uncultured Ruegeria sp. TaxID=259304 RepID=UPI00260D9DAD|nr:HGGxSTG domain-containing protein [uncultured Ruegeria sp.]
MTSETSICGAKAKDGVCMAAPVEGKTRCRIHGGASTGAKTPRGRKRQSEGAKALWAERNRLMALAREIELAAT